MPYIPYTPQAVIAYDNVFTQGAVSASSETSDGAAENAVDGLTYDFWEGEGDTSGDTLEVNVAGGAACDYLAIAAHNLGSSGATITLQGSADGVAWVTVAGPFSPNVDKPWLWRFPSATYAWWRVLILGGPCRLGVLQAGLATVLPEGIYVGHQPAPLNRRPRILNNESESGQLLGRSIIRRGSAAVIRQDRVSPAWVRAVWNPFSIHAETKPFFFAWRHASFPEEVIYGWTDGGAEVEQGQAQFMKVSLDMKGQTGESTPPAYAACVQFSAASFDAELDVSPVTLTVSRTGLDLQQVVTVNYTTVDGTAAAGVDYTAASGTVTFQPGEATAEIEIEILQFTTAKSFSVQLSAPVRATLCSQSGASVVMEAAPSDPLFSDVWSLKHFDSGVLHDQIPGRVWEQVEIFSSPENVALGTPPKFGDFGAYANNTNYFNQNILIRCTDSAPNLFAEDVEFCVEGWERVASITPDSGDTSAQAIWSTQGDSAVAYGLRIGRNGKMQFFSVSSGDTLIESASNLGSGSYVAYRVERVGDEVTLYVEGVGQGSHTLGTLATGGIFQYFNTQGSHGYTGLLDECRITLAYRDNGNYTPSPRRFPDA